MWNVGAAVVLVTGATDGMGKGVARDLAAEGAMALLHGRSPERGEAAMREIREETDSDKLRYYAADFSSLEEVRRLADGIRSDNERLDVLINNASIGAGPSGSTNRQESKDGYELRFAVNYLAPFLLTNLLLPLLRDSAPSRIVNLASVGQAPIDFDDVMLERGYEGMRAYGRSKAGADHVHLLVSRAPERYGRGGQQPAPLLPHGHQDGLRVIRLHDEHGAGGRRGDKEAGDLPRDGGHPWTLLRRRTRVTRRRSGLRPRRPRAAVGHERRTVRPRTLKRHGHRWVREVALPRSPRSYPRHGRWQVI
jgi:NAD(P)-dependent dehydrogenase (short-subunit alcohol dehydrogenase family)